MDGHLTVCGIAEIKVRENVAGRPLTVEYISANGYLVSHSKILHGSKISSLLEIPFYLIVNLLVEDVLLIWKITDDEGGLLFDFEVRNTETQATCNGGIITRANAFLPLSKAVKIEF